MPTSLSSDWQVFGIDPKTGKPTDAAGSSLSVEPARQSLLSQRINAVLASLRKGRANYQKCFSVRQGEALPLSLTSKITERKKADRYVCSLETTFPHLP